uniref:Small ribosomal subunit protein uS17 n=1 Tax=Leptobrachium leishanense TaxID=445787 RepID=A0A8C5MZ71_9ANUR
MSFMFFMSFKAGPSGGNHQREAPSLLQERRAGVQDPPERPSMEPTPTRNCPFTGNVSIRGHILSGVVTKMKMQRTIVIRRDRFEKRHKNMSVHLTPCFRDVQNGDIVTVGECRPLSKTVQFNVLKVTKAAGPTKKQFQKF